jgi:hypothetical protein
MKTVPLALLAFSALSHGLYADDTAKLASLFTGVGEHGGTVTIPPGEYALDGTQPITLPSHTTVLAYGAHFHLPESLGDKARVVIFAGENVRDFRWFGGHFIGHVFDPAREENHWEPNVNTRGILMTTTAAGITNDLTFRDVQSDDLAGAAISVYGAEKHGSDREIEAYARNVTVENCTLERSGKFMWDYGLLWQITVWPEDYTPHERSMAAKYFRNDVIRGPVTMADGDGWVRFDNRDRPVSVSTTDDAANAICFFGGHLPRNIVRGREYFVVESHADGVRIAEHPGGAAIQFEGASGDGLKLMRNVSAAFPSLFAPTGSGPGKGALDLVGCDSVIVRGCRLSALGDTMHIQKSHGVVFANNHITGSRMGAFFLAEFCKNATITGNTVDGTNGSRVISVEKSCEDVTITGNTFRNGGRGAWINQPRNFVMIGNIFINNTTKNEHDPHRGRRSYLTGDYEQKPELYFTLYEHDGSYGPVIVRDNIFVLGPECGSPAVTFAPNGKQLIFKDNAFPKGAAEIQVDPSCTEVDIRDNPGATAKREPVDFNHGRR